MKKLFWFLVCVEWMLVNPLRASQASQNIIVQIHFAGGTQIAANTNFIAFTNLFCSPEALALKEQTFNKMARAPYRFLQKRIAKPMDNEAKRLRPLLDDLLQNEWFLEINDTTNLSPELALAVRLDEGRAEYWRTNLEYVLEKWTGLPSQETQNGWQLKKHLPPDLIRFAQAGDWVVFGFGQDELPLNDEMVQRILAKKRPAAELGTNWLSADVNWQRLAHWLSPTNRLVLPEMKLQITAADGNLRYNGQLIYPQTLSLPMEPWRVPTNIIHEPFASFTAVRGIQSWLEKQKSLADFQNWLPNQIYIWSLAGIPFQTFAAWPMEVNATNAIREIEGTLTKRFDAKLQHYNLGSIQMNTNDDEINWHGLPFISPFMRVEREPAGQFLFAGVYPNSPPSQPLPRELFAQLAKTNLIFYHWEITAERLPEVLNLSQLTLMLTGHPQLDGNSASVKWLVHIGPTLGNNVTEITQTAPNELAFTRKAPGGLTAVEFIALAHWLEATNFPLETFQLPPVPTKISHR